jgi:formylglycine-generating enzyme required for sulfatase activity
MASALAACCHAQSLPIEYIEIPAGGFTVGCSPSESPDMPDGSYEPCQKRAQPAHRVSITRPFEMSKYEVTQGQWEAVMGTNPSYFKGRTARLNKSALTTRRNFWSISTTPGMAIATACPPKPSGSTLPAQVTPVSFRIRLL